MTMLKKHLYGYKKLFDNFFFKICSLDCTNLIKKLILKKLILKTGALTSKPFAFKAWSWELETKYIVNLTDGLGEKIRIDLKGLDIVRILPWLSYKNTEGWISDKTRFSYDGFYLNRVNKFYLRKQLLFVPLVYLLLFLNNNLFKKYFTFFLKKKEFKNKMKWFSISHKAIIDYFFSFFKYLNLFNSLLTCYSTLHFFSNEKKIFVFKLFNQALNLNFFFKNSNNLILKENNKFLNKFFFKFKKKFNLKNLKKIILKFELLQSFQLEKLYFFVLLQLLNKNNVKSANVLASTSVDLQTISSINPIFFKNKIISYNLYFPFFSFSKNFNFKYFKFYNELVTFLHSDFIFLLGANLWLNSPKLHLSLWKVAKNWKIKVISFANNDNLLLSNFNIGFNFKNLFKFLTGQHWLNGFFFKSKKILFVVGEEFLKNSVILNYLKNIMELNKFYFNIKACDFSNKKKEKKNYFLSSFIYTHFNLKVPSSHLLTFNFQNNDFFFKKKWIFTSLFKKENKNKINFFLELNITEESNKFFLSLLKSKKCYNILFESVISDQNIHNTIDFVFPLVNYIEKFSTFINYTGKLNKSLFLKFGPWTSKTFTNFFIFFYSIFVYPFLWILALKKQIFKFIYININLWLYGYLKVFKFKYYKLKWNFILGNFFSIKTKQRNIFKLCNFFIKTNFWDSSNSFVKASRYVKLGYTLYSKKQKTFNFIKL